MWLFMDSIRFSLTHSPFADIIYNALYSTLLVHSVHMIEKLPQHALYSNYAYHVALLKDFSEVSAEDVGRNTAGSGRRASTAVLSSKANASNSSGGESTLSTSTHSSSRNLSDKKQRPAQQRSHSVFM